MRRPLISVLLALLAQAAAAAYPERPITMIVAYPPGGGTDLIARAHPGAVTVGTTGIGSDDHLAMLKFERAAGVKMRHIPFKGSAEVRSAILGKQIMVAAINIGEALQYQKGGSPLRNLVQMSPARTNLAPGLATAREQGYDIEMSSLRGLVGPKGLPQDVRERLVNAVAVSLADPKRCPLEK